MKRQIQICELFSYLYSSAFCAFAIHNLKYHELCNCRSEREQFVHEICCRFGWKRKPGNSSFVVLIASNCARVPQRVDASREALGTRHLFRIKHYSTMSIETHIRSRVAVRARERTLFALARNKGSEPGSEPTYLIAGELRQHVMHNSGFLLQIRICIDSACQFLPEYMEEQTKSRETHQWIMSLMRW